MALDPEQERLKEDYVHDYKGALTEHIIAGRTADTHGAFFLPHLRAGMTVLDCGCGPGTITVGLARAAAPGAVTGIDLAASQVELARENAAKHDFDNIAFERGDVYQLPYPDDTFDAVFSHAMLEHLNDPLAVLREMRRVLKPGGVVGIRCIDLGGTLIAPADAALERAHDIWGKYREHCGGDPFMGRRLRAVLSQAGFARAVGSASSETWGTPQLAQSMMLVLIDEFTGPKIAQAAIQMGWADQSQMDRAASELKAWGQHPDAFMAIVWCEAVGWKE
ncbi:MAG: class I SAM-dependent methyltransferase [Pseudomonadota bacterium]